MVVPALALCFPFQQTIWWWQFYWLGWFRRSILWWWWWQWWWCLWQCWLLGKPVPLPFQSSCYATAANITIINMIIMIVMIMMIMMMVISMMMRMKVIVTSAFFFVSPSLHLKANLPGFSSRWRILNWHWLHLFCLYFLFSVFAWTMISPILSFILIKSNMFEFFIEKNMKAK